ncbi:hypothetical protein [Ferrimicrobium sp.]|uniref:hypothetical protein n=1 Tax=Ferrimicrobium sp. TaxID=2926050 RepID=UPI00262DB7B0|nr:hypothetical protein [Ferrimicrobium sp.]
MLRHEIEDLTDRLAAAPVESLGETGVERAIALSESLNGLYRAELIKAVGVQDDEIAVEWETYKCVEWYNTITRALGS